MTQPTHGLDPKALEAAVLPCDIHLPPATTLCKGVSLAALLTGLKARGMVLPDLAALSQNPGTSNTSGEALVWRGHEIPIRCPYPEYGRAGAPIAYDIDPGQGSATNRLVRDWPHEEYIDHLRISDGEITPLFAALEPRASDRERTIEECAKVAEALTGYTGEGTEYLNDGFGMFARGARMAKTRIAAAIRNLAGTNTND